MNKDKFSRLILNVAFFLVVFYPFKGLFSFLLSLVIGEDVSFLVIRFSFILVLSFIVLNVFVNNLLFVSRTDKILFAFGLFGLVIGLARRDMALLYNTFLLFGLPVLFSQFPKIKDGHFFKAIYAFFMISTVYMLGENVILHPQRFGLDFTPPSAEEFAAFSNYLVDSEYSDASVFLADFRHIGLTNRTGGYIANILAMPVLLSMGAVFFYILAREKKNIVNLILALVSSYLLASSLSTTAIIAFIITVLFYEVYVRRNFTSLLIAALFGMGVVIFAVSSDIGIYVYNRLLANLEKPEYVRAFFGRSGLFTAENILYLVVGRWAWGGTATIPSHIDMVLIPVAYGGLIGWLLYKRMLSSLIRLAEVKSICERTFAPMVFTAFVCMFHHFMTLNINVMIIVTLLYLKANEAKKHCYSG